MPANEISKLVLESNIPLIGQIRDLVKLHLEKLKKTNDPYEQISRILTVVAQTAYSAQLYRVTHQQGLSMLLPEHPVEISIVRDSLPRSLLDEIVKSIETWGTVYLHNIKTSVEDNIEISVRHYIDTEALEALILLSKYKQEVDTAYRELTKILAELRENAGTSDIHISVNLVFCDVMSDEMRIRGYKKLKIVSGTHRETNIAKFKEVVEKNGFKVKESQLGKLKHVAASKHFGDVEVFIDCDSNGFGFIIIELLDIPPKIPKDITEPLRIENVEIRPLPISGGAEAASNVRSLYERRVQQIGRKLAIYLTEPLQAIGLNPGDRVRVIVDRQKKEIIITPY